MCVAAVDLKRAETIEGDFADCMENLQRATEKVSDVRSLLKAASRV